MPSRCVSTIRCGASGASQGPLTPASLAALLAPASLVIYPWRSKISMLKRSPPIVTTTCIGKGRAKVRGCALILSSVPDFPLMADREHGYKIGAHVVSGNVAAIAEVDHQFAELGR